MATSERAALLPLAESIADGSVIDWDAAEASASADDKAVIRQLRVLANVAGLHRRAAPVLAVGNWAHLTLLERLGGGTFGDVYRAWDRHLEREVALKLLRGADDNDLQASRIASEGRLLARVRHPNVITVHGVDVHDNRVGLWMELVRGATLEQALADRGPCSAREAALVGIDLCRALAALHGAGLIHRDVKAQNVIREDGGRIVLMDLGTGRALEQDRGPLGHAGSDLAGTPLYLAPEIFDGASASEATDLYSLGVLLYHLVTGAFPIKAATMAELRDGHTRKAGVRLRDARADLPTAFVTVIERAIAANPAERYASAGALEAALVSSLDEADKAPARPFAWRRGGIIVAGLAAVLVLGLAGWPAFRARTAPTSVSGPIRSIAVLPLANLSGDPAQEYFADGMTDELIGTLGQLGNVKVISRTSAMQFKGSPKPLPDIARALNVDAVLEGSAMVVPGDARDPAGSQRVRINARLIYAGTDTQLWDRTFETVVGDVLALQRQVANAVADGIHLRLSSSDSGTLAATSQRGGPQNFEAFSLYLKGRYYWNMRTPDSLKQSVQYFQEAIARGYTPGYAGLADAYNLLGFYGAIPRADAHVLARAAAAKALELDDSLAEAHVSLGFVHHEHYEWDAAETHYKRALALNPGYATGHHWYAMTLVQLGRFDEAMSEVKTALALDPLSNGINGQLGAILVFHREYDQAITHLEQALQLDPAFFNNRMVLAEAYAHKGAYDLALSQLTKAAETGGNDAPLRAEFGYVYAVAGRTADALKVAGELAARADRNEDAAAGAAATVYAGLGDRDRTMQWLERARRRLDPIIVDIKVDPRFDKIRGDERFTNLLASVGLSR